MDYIAVIIKITCQLHFSVSVQVADQSAHMRRLVYAFVVLSIHRLACAIKCIKHISNVVITEFKYPSIVFFLSCFSLSLLAATFVVF